MLSSLNWSCLETCWQHDSFGNDASGNVMCNVMSGWCQQLTEPVPVWLTAAPPTSSSSRALNWYLDITLMCHTVLCYVDMLTLATTLVQTTLAPWPPSHRTRAGHPISAPSRSPSAYQISIVAGAVIAARCRQLLLSTQRHDLRMTKYQVVTSYKCRNRIRW